MSVIHREHPVNSPHPVRGAALEDILRDAACFASEDDAPTGLAHRALARRIATQRALKTLPSRGANRKPGILLWFGGLSAGTLAGAAAAVLVIAHLNGNAFRISPETASLSTAALRESETNTVRTDETPAGIKNLSRPHQPAALTGASVTASKQSIPEARVSAHRSLPREVPARSTEWSPRREQDSLPATRPRSVASHTASPARLHTAPPVARWKTEPFEETEYQLVTAAYTPEPASGGYAGGSDHIQLTPLKMRASLDQSESDPMAGPSLPPY